MLPLLGAMLVSNTLAGMLIAQVGRYKWFAVVGFSLSTLGFLALSQLGTAAPALALPLCLVVLGAGTGMIFPTLTLSYQSAVRFDELGVATALNQFSRAMGGTLGAALFGTLLVLRFAAEAGTSAPFDVTALLSGPIASGTREALANSLHWVFASACLVSVLGLLGSLVWRDLSIRRPVATRAVSQSDP